MLRAQTSSPGEHVCPAGKNLPSSPSRGFVLVCRWCLGLSAGLALVLAALAERLVSGHPRSRSSGL